MNINIKYGTKMKQYLVAAIKAFGIDTTCAKIIAVEIVEKN